MAIYIGAALGIAIAITALTGIDFITNDPDNLDPYPSFGTVRAVSSQSLLLLFSLHVSA